MHYAAITVPFRYITLPLHDHDITVPLPVHCHYIIIPLPYHCHKITIPYRYHTVVHTHTRNAVLAFNIAQKVECHDCHAQNPHISTSSVLNPSRETVRVLSEFLLAYSSATSFKPQNLHSSFQAQHLDDLWRPGHQDLGGGQAAVLAVSIGLGVMAVVLAAMHRSKSRKPQQQQQQKQPVFGTLPVDIVGAIVVSTALVLVIDQE